MVFSFQARFSALAALALLAALVLPLPSMAQPAGTCGPNPSPPDAADPSVRVVTPAAGAPIRSPLRVSGEARVFEGTVSLMLLDAAGDRIAAGTAQAAAGAPARAPFAADLPLTVVRETPACLWVFEASAADGSPRNVVQVPLTLLPPPAVYTEAALDLGEPRPCIPAPEQPACDATRTALWNGEASAWAARGVTDPDARFNETVVFRAQAGDPVAISNIARILGWPYVKITRARFVQDKFVEVTNLGGGPQDISGWTLRAIGNTPFGGGENAFQIFPAGTVLPPGGSCTVYAGPLRNGPPGACLVRTTLGGGRTPAGVWLPPDAGQLVLFAAPIGLLADDTRYNADPANQPPPPNLQGVGPLMSTTPQPGLSFSLSTSKQVYAPGEPVEFRMELRNTGGSAVDVTFNSGQRFDVTVVNESGARVWQWAIGKLFTQVISTITLAPGESMSFTATWNQQPNGGGMAPPGTYRAQAVLTAGDRPESNEVTFRIAGP